WANKVKEVLLEKNLMNRPLHIISANMHSVMNTLYASEALKAEVKKKSLFGIYEDLSNSANGNLRMKVTKSALAEGMMFIEDTSGANIDVQIFDSAKMTEVNEKFR